MRISDHIPVNGVRKTGFLPDREVCIFDFDGTLVDSMPAWGENIFRLLRSKGVEPPDGLLRELAPLGDKGIARYLLTHFDMRCTEAQLLAAMERAAFTVYRDSIPAKPGAAELLHNLKEGGRGVYLLTASPQKLFSVCLARLGLLPLFDAAWCADEFGINKRTPELYRQVAARIGCSVGDILFFDDNPHAIRAARDAGLCTVAVYDEAGAADTAALKVNADYYIKSFFDILETE